MAPLAQCSRDGALGMETHLIPWRWVLFDLDGTVSDPATGITRSVIHAMQSLGYTPPAPSSILWVVGPPLRDTFQRLVPQARSQEIEQLVAAFRARYVPIGMYENELYPAMAETLAACAAAGQTLGLATLKPTFLARRVLKHFRLTALFSSIVGSYLDGRRDDKAKVIRRSLAVLGADPARTVMIGDRASDVLAARSCGVPAIGVRWGYAPAGELQRSGPIAIVNNPLALQRLLLP